MWFLDMNVQSDDEQQAWAVDLKKGVHDVRHYLADEDARPCLDQDSCVALGIDSGQFR